MFGPNGETGGEGAGGPGPCAKIVAAVFGTMLLVAFLAVPVTTRTSQVRQEPGSNLVTRTVYPRRATMFLPQYLSARARGGGDKAVTVRSTPWIATMAVVAALGIVDYVAFCRLLCRRRRPENDSE